MAFKEQSLTPPVPFPVPDFDNVTAAFGPSESSYLTKAQLGDWMGLYGDNSHTPFHNCVEGLFHAGGRIEDYGMSFKPEIDPAKAYRALASLMRSFAPKHEVKIGTAAVALANWCNYDPAADTKKQAA